MSEKKDNIAAVGSWSKFIKNESLEPIRDRRSPFAVYQAGYVAGLKEGQEFVVQMREAAPKPVPGVVKGVCRHCEDAVTVSYGVRDMGDGVWNCSCPLCKQLMQLRSVEEGGSDAE